MCTPASCDLIIFKDSALLEAASASQNGYICLEQELIRDFLNKVARLGMNGYGVIQLSDDYAHLVPHPFLSF